jgi:hypothetical protein
MERNEDAICESNNLIGADLETPLDLHRSFNTSISDEQA